MSLPPPGNSFRLKTQVFAEIILMEKKLLQELEPLSEPSFTSFSRPDFSHSEFFAMQKVLVQCAESFTDYLAKSQESIRFTDNVIPLKKEFLKFTVKTNNSQSLFGEI